MASPLSTAIPLRGKSKSNYSRLYAREYERNNKHNSNRHRDHRSKSIWRRTQKLVWNKCNRIWGYYRFSNNLHPDCSWRRLSTRCHNQISRYTDWFSSVRNNRYRQNHKHNRYHYLLIGLLTIGLPVYAEGDETNNIAAPESTATGNVTNQAVQFQNNGAPSRQQMGGYNNRAIACNGPTMTFSPFWLASENKPYDPDSYSRGWNYGAQLNFMFPMDYSITERCKSLAKRQEEKMRVDYELVRTLKCAELMQKGFTIRPGSRVEHMCNDVVPIVSVIKLKPTEKK